jgi:hypothetical protein
MCVCFVVLVICIIVVALFTKVNCVYMVAVFTVVLLLPLLHFHLFSGYGFISYDVTASPFMLRLSKLNSAFPALLSKLPVPFSSLPYKLYALPLNYP